MRVHMWSHVEGIHTVDEDGRSEVTMTHSKEIGVT
jgi:hypothetical protein